MVVCVVDDLMFSVKISTAARALGTPVYFERDAAKVLASIREKSPSLVILDLNGSRLRPFEVIAAMKADETLREIRTLGYVAHVDAELVAAARRAGIDDVMARSAFSERMGEVLRGR
jgi:PleD family two-component response regulator